MLHCPRTTSLSMVCSALFLGAAVNFAFAADVTGDWRVADGVANIRVAQCNGSMWGVVAWEKIPGGKDINNPDVSKQSRPTFAMPILIDMKKKAGVADTWEGQVYNAKDGQLYNSTIKPTGTDQLEIQGCVLGFLCGGETWTRVAPPIPSSPTNSMAKGSAKGAPGALPKAATGPVATTAAPSQAQAVPPKTTAGVSASPKPAFGPKPAPGQPADIGDICLLPDIARFAH
jgi:uncharacterized protein (DUF2147 family)